MQKGPGRHRSRRRPSSTKYQRKGGPSVLPSHCDVKHSYSRTRRSAKPHLLFRSNTSGLRRGPPIHSPPRSSSPGTSECVEVKMKKLHAAPSATSPAIRIGTAGWTLPKQHAQYFPETGTHLERCAQGFNCVEINSSFHRPHQRKTWERWARCTPPDFRFAVKLPKAITHIALLANCGALLQNFFDEVRGLGDKLGPLLVQLPPKLAFDEALAHEFFTTLRELHSQDLHTGFVTLEPRHASWFASPVDRLLRSFDIARVAVDPPKGSPLAATPGGWRGLCYWRLHGAPRTYYSAYDTAFLGRLARQLGNSTCTATWVIFDNTALGHATGNALELRSLILGPQPAGSAGTPSQRSTRPARSAPHESSSSR